MNELTEKDFENVLSFYAAINSDYENFEKTVLISLTTIFGFKLVSFGTFKIDDVGSVSVINISSTYLPGEMAEKYKKVYCKDDAFLQNYFKLCYANLNTSFFTAEHLAQFGIEHGSGYKSLLNKYNIAHEAIVGVNASPGRLIRNIKICTTVDNGPFTEREKRLFQYIGDALNVSSNLYDKYLNRQYRAEVLSTYFNEISFGFAILSENGKLIHKNDAFMTLSSGVSSALTISEIVYDVIFAVTGTDKLPKDIHYHEEKRVNDLIVILQKKRVVLSTRIENLIFITIHEDKREHTSALDSFTFISRYGLTRREADIALLLVDGYRNQEIADKLYIGAATVKTHISAIYSKMMVNSRSEMLLKFRSEMQSDAQNYT